MTIAEAVMHRLRPLTEDQQRQVLAYMDSLQPSRPDLKPSRIDPYGLFADQPTNLSFEDFEEIRRTIWDRSTEVE